jgi:exo-1,4-beta-D-glucosaminidase
VRAHIPFLAMRVAASVLLLLVLCAADFPDFARPGPPPSTIELAQGWTLSSADGLHADGAALSRPDYRGDGWHQINRMPSTVLQTLQSDGTYPNLYVGTNLAAIPQDLYKKDWWYRTGFTAPAGHSTYVLEFPGINYRAQVWLNGHLVASDKQIVGMYAAHDVDVSRWVNPGGRNALAVKVTPERALQDIDGVELADSWYDWINRNRLESRGSGNGPVDGNAFVPDRNAGIWKPVYLRSSGDVTIGPSAVNTELPLPRTDSAKLTIHSRLRNASRHQVRGVLRATITRPGKHDIEVEQPVTLAAGEQRDVDFDPARYGGGLDVTNPDLWWPYTMGDPNLYDLRLEFRQFGRATDSSELRFGIRTVSQHRDADQQFPELGQGGNFYLKINGRDFLVRGAAYTPDLLFADDPARDAATLRYVKDLGLNMIRLEGKFPGDRIVEMADEMGIPMMFGWMCCNQWEKWSQWDDEDNRVAQDSMRSQILTLRDHPSVFLWANASDGLPPPAVREKYHKILSDLHWQNAVVDTVSSLATDAHGKPIWDGIQMAGPYSWRPPSYWFSGRYAATRGATAEQGDNENIPPLASLKKFIPADKLWPLNDTWWFHAGSDVKNAALSSIRRAILRRYGPSDDVEEFARKAQVAEYESTRAQFEAFAANGWDNHKMTIYWMLNNHWPSFFGHIFDYYLRPGGTYFGAKKGLRPLSVVFDSYATGNHDEANVTVVNQTADDVQRLRARVRVYDLQGKVRYDRTADDLNVAAGGAARALTMPRIAGDSNVFFVRCELFDQSGKRLTENVYWQSQRPDDVGAPSNDWAFELRQTSWADMTALDHMGQTALQISARRPSDEGDDRVVVRLHNPTGRVAFFERVEVSAARDSDEILPIEYSDNYVTVFPGETVDVDAVVPTTGVTANWARVSGYNTPEATAPIR